jgi:hypothetical protein
MAAGSGQRGAAARTAAMAVGAAALVTAGAVLFTRGGGEDEATANDRDIPLATLDPDIPLAPIDPDIPLAPIEPTSPLPPSQWRGTITLDGRIMELDIEECAMGEREIRELWDGDFLVRDGYDIWIEGDVAGGVFDISRRLYPPFGWNDHVSAEIGRRGWYSHDPTVEEDWFWFEIDGRRITGQTGFRFYTDYEAEYDDHVMVVGSIDVMC